MNVELCADDLLRLLPVVSEQGIENVSENSPKALVLGRCDST